MMDENKSLIITFLNQVLTTFGISIIAISIVGWSMGDVTKGIEGLLSMGRDGLSYVSLLQVLIFSITQGIFRIITGSDLFIKKMMLLWRVTLMFLLSIISAIILSILFHWFPTESFEAWMGFIISMTACFAFGLIFMLVILKLENKKYDELLSNYKIKLNQKKDDEK